MKNRFNTIIEQMGSEAKRAYKKRIDKLLCRPLEVRGGGKMEMEKVVNPGNGILVGVGKHCQVFCKITYKDGKLLISGMVDGRGKPLTGKGGKREFNKGWDKKKLNTLRAIWGRYGSGVGVPGWVLGFLDELPESEITPIGEMGGEMGKYRFSRGELMEKDISNFNIGDEIEVGVGARYKVVVVEKRVKTGTVTPLTNRAGKCNVPEYIKDFIHGFRG